jgi:hypothetical protein
MMTLPKKIQTLFILVLFMGLLISQAHGEEPSPARVSEPEEVPLAPVPEVAAPNAAPSDARDADAAPVLSPESPGPETAPPQQGLPVLEMAWPAAFIPEPEFEFAPVVDGAQIVHDFIIENQGTTPLLIKDIRTGCACAVASFPRFILPQDKSKITITIDTTGYGGRDFSRVIMISTNERINPMLKVMISGRIDDFAHFEPKKTIFLRGMAKEEIKSIVTITPTEKHPFTITHFEADEAIKDLVTFSIEKKDKKYILTAENRMKIPGRYMGKLHIQTDSTFKPQINMLIRGIIE